MLVAPVVVEDDVIADVVEVLVGVVAATKAVLLLEGVVVELATDVELVVGVLLTTVDCGVVDVGAGIVDVATGVVEVVVGGVEDAAAVVADVVVLCAAEVLDALLLLSAESTASAFPHTLSGPLFARNATMMFSPERPSLPQADLIGSIIA